MTVLNKFLSPIFLEENEIRKLIELLLLSYQDFIGEPDIVVKKINFTSTHYKIIYFAGKQKGIAIKDLLIIINITKQSLSRLINELVENKYINIDIGSDKRTKQITLTSKGLKLENELSKIQIIKIRNVLKNFNETDIKGFKKILFEIINSERKKILENLYK